MNFDAIIFYLLALALGAATIVAGTSLARRHAARFLRLFRTFLVVYVLYVFLFFAGQILLIEAGATVSGSRYVVYQSVSVLAEPAWSVFVYLLLAWSAALVGWTVPRGVRWSYWILQAVLYGVIFTIIGVYGETTDRRGVIRLGQAADVVFHAIVYGALLVLLVGAFRGRGARRRALAFRLGIAYAAGFGVATAATFTWLPWDTSLREYLVSRALLYFLVNAAPLAILGRFLARNRLEPLDDGAEAPPLALELDGLTAREREIVPLVAEGLTNEEIAERLFVSVKTVKNNVSNVYRKLGLRNRVELSNRYRESRPAP